MKRLLLFITNAILLCIIIGCNNKSSIDSFINPTSGDITSIQNNDTLTDNDNNSREVPLESKIDGCALLYVGHNAFGELVITKNGGFITDDIWYYSTPIFIKRKYCDSILKYIESVYFTDGKFDSEFSNLKNYTNKDIFADSIDSFVLTMFYYENGKRIKPKWEPISICVKDSTISSSSDVKKLNLILDGLCSNYNNYNFEYCDTVKNPHRIKI